MSWNEIVEKITPFIVKIETPEGHGTGFLCLYNETRFLCGIATAHHVIAHADKWHEPVRITHLPSSSHVMVKESDRVVYSDADTDSAVVLVPTGTLKLPENLIPLRPIQDRLPIGAEVGWLGYPAIGQGSNTLCFFSGTISAWQQQHRAYLIDGVSINGVSGGPVIYSTPTDGLQIVGAVSAYIVNRATGEALPGLAVAQDVSHFQLIAGHVRSIDEASKKKAAEQSVTSTTISTLTVDPAATASTTVSIAPQGASS